MARIIYSALVESIRGSIKGTTFQRNAYGYTVKGKPNMVKPHSLYQQLQKVAMTEVAQAWRSLTEGNRSDWATYAENNPRPSRLNPDSYLNAYNYFLLVNRFRRLANLSILTSPSSSQYDVGVVDYFFLLDSGDLIFETNPSVVSGDWTWLLFCSPSIPLGREYVSFTPRFLDHNDYDVGTQFNITNEYQTKLGTLPSADQWIGVKVVLLEATNGQVIINPTTQLQVVAV